MTTPDDVAQWMRAEVIAKGYVEQETMVHDIAKRFGAEFTYDNENGNPAIDRKVLRVFKKISDPEIVRESGERAWRKREKYDESGRRQS